MNIKNKIVSKKFLQAALTSVIAGLAVAGIVSASTTIGTNVSTGGTLSVTGASTLTGAVTTSAAVTVGTDLTVTSGATIGDATGTHLTALADDSLIVQGESEFDGIAWFDGELRASSSAMVQTDLTVFSGARVGYGSTGTHLTALADDSLFVEGQSEFDGISWFDNSLRASSTAVITGTTTLYASLVIPQVGSDTPMFHASGTAVSIGNGSVITSLLWGTCSVDIGTIAASSTAVADCTAQGVTTGHKVFVTPTFIDNRNVIFTSASSTAANTIQVAAFYLGNDGATVDPAASTWSWMAIK